MKASHPYAGALLQAQLYRDYPELSKLDAQLRGTMADLAELALSGDPLLPAAVWCAKEALYKYARCPGLDLLHDLRVEAVDFAAGIVVGRIGGGEAIRLTLHRADGFITVYTV